MRRPAALTYRSTRVSGAGDAFRIDGEATIGAVTRPLTFEVDFGGLEPFVDGVRHAGFEGRGELRRSDFGIDLGLPPGVRNVALGDAIRFELDVQLLEPAA